MRLLVPLLAAMALACASKPDHPPALDTIGGQPLPHGGSSGADAASPSTDGGVTTVLATGLASARGIAASGALVYVTVPAGVNGASGVLSIPKTGGLPQPFVSNPSDPPKAIAASSTTACFSTDGGNVYCAPLHGGAISTLALGESGIDALSLSNDLVYWASAQGGASIERCGIGGTGRAVIGSASGPFAPTGIAVAGSALYFTTTGAGANVYTLPTSGGVAEGLVPPITSSWVDTIVDGPRVLVGHQVEGASGIFAIPTTGGGPTAIAQNLPSIAHLARDNAHLYWTSPSDGAVYGMTLATNGPPIVLATGLSSPYAITVDDAIYVTTTDSVVRVSRLP